MALNFNVLKTPPGYLKLIHVILGAVAFGIIIYYVNHASVFNMVSMPKEFLFFLLVSFALLVTSTVLLISFLYEETADSIWKTHFEIIYHLLAFALYISASITLITLLSKSSKQGRDSTAFALYVIAAVLGIINSVAYAGNAFLAFKRR